MQPMPHGWDWKQDNFYVMYISHEQCALMIETEEGWFNDLFIYLTFILTP